jgi:hypothetical protein
MAGRVQLLQFADDVDEGLDPLRISLGLDLVGPDVDVEVIERLLQGAQVRLSRTEEFDEVDGVGNDETNAVGGTGLGAVGRVRIGIGGVLRIRGGGDVQNVPLRAGPPSPVAPGCASSLVARLTNGPMNSGP